MLKSELRTVRKPKATHQPNTSPTAQPSPGARASLSSNKVETESMDPQESRRLNLQRCLQSLIHACQCHNANCSLPSCQEMKRVVQHSKRCRRKTNGGCPVCKKLIELCCYHAKYCQENTCPVLWCPKIKYKMRQPQIQHRLQQARLM